jgi:SRSO17 transposase
MDAQRLLRLRDDLTGYLDAVLPDLGRQGRRAWAELYLRGLLLDGRRKSAGAIAERLQRIDRSPRDYEQGLQQFVSQSPWEDRAPRDHLARHLQGVLDADGLLILDDTGFPKQGTHSVGVGRQYSGTLGKVGNCQVGVTLQYATDREVVCLDADLYLLEEEWGNDPDRLQAAGVPEGVGYRPKWQIGLALLERAQANGFTGVVLADSAYGDVTEFRQTLSAGSWSYCVGVGSTLKVLAADADLGEVPPYTGRGRPPSRPEKVRPGAMSASVLAWAQSRARSFRKVTWREGSKGKLSSRFAAWRVRPAHRLSAGKEPLSPCWLIAEWPEGEAEPTKFFFSNLPETTALRSLVRTAKGRWWVEHSYKELKDELGLDHFEGRFWRGWQHHVTLVLLAYAFLVLQRRQRREKKGAPK